MTDWTGSGSPVPSGMGSDPYIDAATAGAWLLAHVTFIDAWTNNPSSRTAALMEASDHIDALPLKGWKYADDITQPREFPRIPDRAAQVIPEDSEILFQSEEDYDEVPQEVLDACCLEALAILDRGNTLRLQNQREGVQSQSISGSSENYVLGAGQEILLSVPARQKLRHWLAGAVEAV